MKGFLGLPLWSVLAICLVTTASGMTTQPTVNQTEMAANTSATTEITQSATMSTTTTTAKATTTTTKATPTMTVAGASKITTAGPKIGTIAKATTPPAPKYYNVSTCKSITVECPQKDWTVHVNRVFGGRKLDPTCTADRAECCEAKMDNRTECLVENTVLVRVQREYCLKRPGEPCLIFAHSSHYIGCKDNLVSQYTVVEFYCAYIPIPTPNDTTVVTTPTPTVPDTTKPQPTTTMGDNTSTPKPLPIAIIAGSAGGGVFIIIIIVVIVCCVRMRKQRIMKQDMTKAQLFANPVSEIGVNYMDAEKGSNQDPDIIKTTPKVANGKPYNSS